MALTSLQLADNEGQRQVTQQSITREEAAQLAEAIRQMCIQAALSAHENARIDGLCHEGAWECAVDALRTVELATLVQQLMPVADS